MLCIRYSASWLSLVLQLWVINRGGVEDTRLEAKDTKKIRGQGPRTQAQVLSKKKKVLHKNFLGDLQKKKIKVFTTIL